MDTGLLDQGHVSHTHDTTVFLEFISQVYQYDFFFYAIVIPVLTYFLLNPETCCHNILFWVFKWFFLLVFCSNISLLYLVQNKNSAKTIMG